MGAKIVKKSDTGSAGIKKYPRRRWKGTSAG
jgi:hypothetical protein